MKIGIVILCRFSSSRLPGKILKEINGIPILKYIFDRLQTVFPIEDIVVATSFEQSDDVIEQYCQKNYIKCYRGSLDNVASRFLNCSIENQFDYAIRINGDNIFIDIDLLDKVKNIVQQKSTSFISNVHNRTYPKGMSVECVSVELYKNSISKFSDYDKEHVMTYFYTNSDKIDYLYLYNTEYAELAGVQLAIDTQEDFDRAQYIIDKLNIPNNEFDLNDIANIISENLL